MKYISLKEQLLTERKKNAAMSAAAAKNTADIDYIAMMCDVEIPTNETEEAADDEQI